LLKVGILDFCRFYGFGKYTLGIGTLGFGIQEFSDQREIRDQMPETLSRRTTTLLERDKSKPLCFYFLEKSLNWAGFAICLIGGENGRFNYFKM
jgi:hypothetical protein